MDSFILSKKALEDLSKIWDYTFDVWSESQADKYYYLILNACESLGKEAIAGKPYPEVHADLHGLSIGQHIIFYRKLKNGKIEIARILHSLMDLRNRPYE